MIVDCFPFFNELDLLEIRLHELAPVVDRFVLCEATLTHSGKPKPLVFRENKDRFRDFPIDHVVVDAYFGVDQSKAWEMEHYQRQVGVEHAVTKYCLGAKDIVVMSDCDEIPAATAVRDFCTKDWTVATLMMEMYYYYLNLRRIDKIWRFAKLFRPVEIPVDTNSIRRSRKGPFRRIPCILDGGWHFSYLGGVDTIKTKLDAFAHREDAIQQWNTVENIQKQMAAGKDLFHRGKYKFFPVKGTAFLPQYVQDNLDRFRGLLCDCPS